MRGLLIFFGVLMLKTIDIRGIKIADVTMEEAVSFISEKLNSDTSLSVFTPNAEIAYRAIHDPALMKILNRCDMSVPDGIGIVKASRILGCPLREKVAGVELGLKVAELAANNGRSIFFYGGRPGVAEKAASELTKKYPELKTAGFSHGYRDDTDSVIREIKHSDADIVFVCLGSPMQEKWIDENRTRLPNVKLFMGLGGSLDIYSGNVRRAPRIFIKLGLEWFYRLLKEPKRILRMTALPRFYLGTWLYKLRR